MTDYYGDFARGTLVDIKWNTYAQSGASITRQTNGTLRIYKNNSTVYRASAAGIVETEDFNGVTGVHHIRIDLNDNSDAGFWAPGNEYQLCMTGMVIDGINVNYDVAAFSIERIGGAIEIARGMAQNYTPELAAVLSAMGALMIRATIATVTAAGDFTLSPSVDLSTTDNAYKDSWFVFSSGPSGPAGKGIARKCSIYTGASLRCQFTNATPPADAPFPFTPVAGQQVMILGHG